MPVKPDPYMIDDENPELTDAEIAAMRPASEVLPPKLYAALVARYEARKAGKLESVTIDLAPDVAAKLRATGPDWAAHAGAILRKAVGL